MRFGSANKRPEQKLRGFTLVELLAAGAVFMLILALTLMITSNLAKWTKEGSSSLAAFQEARTAFETMNRMLSQAVLNTYWDYDDPNNPSRYLRASELHFVMGPAAGTTGLSQTAGSAVFCQAPMGLTSVAAFKFQPNLLNALGFYVRFSQSEDLPDFLVSQKPQSGAWRLWLYFQPTESFKVYENYDESPQAPSNSSWLQGDIANPVRNHVLANNIIFLLIRAGHRDADGDWQWSYVYDSRRSASDPILPQAVEVHQLPPALSVTLVAIDQRTADLLRDHSGGAAYDLLPSGGIFTNPEIYQEDMEDFSRHLNNRPLAGIPVQYRVFETVVNITSSRWSR